MKWGRLYVKIRLFGLYFKFLLKHRINYCINDSDSSFIEYCLQAL